MTLRSNVFVVAGIAAAVVALGGCQSTKRALNMHVKRAVAGVLEYALSEEFNSFETDEHQALITKFLERSKDRAAASA